MDLLTGYSDSDDEDNASAVAPAPKEQPAPASQPKLTKAEGQPAHQQQQNTLPPVSMFNPFAPTDDSSAAAKASPQGTKRGHNQVTGGSLTQSSAPQKAAKTPSTSTGPKPAFNSALVPPQLRNGRANISTEDYERMFSKGAIKKHQQKHEQ